MNISDLPPSDFKWTTKDDPHRCWTCGYYSFKTYGDENNTTGKCFRDHKEKNDIRYVNGLMTCPGWIENEDGTYDPREEMKL